MASPYDLNAAERGVTPPRGGLGVSRAEAREPSTLRCQPGEEDAQDNDLDTEPAAVPLPSASTTAPDRPKYLGFTGLGKLQASDSQYIFFPLHTEEICSTILQRSVKVRHIEEQLNTIEAKWKADGKIMSALVSSEENEDSKEYQNLITQKETYLINIYTIWFLSRNIHDLEPPLKQSIKPLQKYISSCLGTDCPISLDLDPEQSRVIPPPRPWLVNRAVALMQGNPKDTYLGIMRAQRTEAMDDDYHIADFDETWLVKLHNLMMLGITSSFFLVPAVILFVLPNVGNVFIWICIGLLAIFLIGAELIMKKRFEKILIAAAYAAVIGAYMALWVALYIRCS